MSYTPDAALGTMPTLSRTLMNTDGDAIVTGSKEVDLATQMQSGSRLRAEALEFNRHVTTVSDYCAHKFKRLVAGGGQGLPVMFTDDPAAQLVTFDSIGEELDWQTQNFVNVVGVLRVPVWTGEIGTPRWRLKRVSVTAKIIVNDATQTESDTSALQFSNDAALASELEVRVHRVARAAFTPEFSRRSTSSGIEDPSAVVLNEGKNASRLAVKQGMRVLGGGFVGSVHNITEAGIGAFWAGSTAGALSGVTFRSIQVGALLGGDVLALRQNLAPGDVVVVSITGSDRIIYAGESTFDATKRNVILPVRGHMVVGAFVTEMCA